MAAMTTLALVAGLAGLGESVLSARKKPSVPTAPVVPPAPDVNAEQAAATALLTARKSKAYLPGTPSGTSATLLTGPGLSAPANTQTKTLLGL